MDEKIRYEKPNPILKANAISKLFMCWISPLLSLGYKRSLESDDLNDPVPIEKSKYLTDKLEVEWNKELSKLKINKKPSLLRALIRCYGWQLFLNSILIFIEEMAQVAQPLLVAELQGYFENKIDFMTAILYGASISGIVTLIWLVHHPYSQNVARYGMRVRIACCGLVYRKSLRMTSNTLDSKTSGRMLNLLANDATRLDQVLLYLPYFVIAPLQLVCIIVLLVKKVDISYLAGLLIFILYMPLQASLAKLFNYFRTKSTSKTDERINLVSEILNGIKIIKMYCWELPFKKLITRIRGREIRYEAYLHSISAINSLFENDLPCFITYMSVAIFTNYMNILLKPSFLVYAMGYYTKACTMLGFYLSRTITMSMGALVSLKRFEEFLLYPESETNDNKRLLQSISSPYIKVENLSASWSKNFENFYLAKMTFDANPNELVAVVGPTGSGKSSLLLVLLGEIENITGKMDVKGTVFYVSQEPWIFTSTLKQNILFGKPFDQEKFDSVLKCCCLDKDLMLLPNGENTMIGEKGINLSGGQRARVNLARALYYDAQIYLFDDPLSAVDTNVSKLLFDNCINEFLKNKIRILVTHQVHHLEKADRILLLNDGDLIANGTFKELRDKGFNLHSMLNLATQSNSQPNQQQPQQPHQEQTSQNPVEKRKDSVKTMPIIKSKLIIDKKEQKKLLGDEAKAEGKSLIKKEKKLEKKKRKLWKLIKRSQKKAGDKDENDKKEENDNEEKKKKKKMKKKKKKNKKKLKEKQSKLSLDNEDNDNEKSKEKDKEEACLNEDEDDDDDDESKSKSSSSSSTSSSSSSSSSSSESSSSSSDDDEDDEEEDDEDEDDDEAEKVEYDEKQTVGKISWKVYTDYFRSGGGIFGGILVILLFILSQLFILSADYWVSDWATVEASYEIEPNSIANSSIYNYNNNESLNYSMTMTYANLSRSFEENRKYYFIRYSILIGATLILVAIRSVIFFLMCVRSSYRYHKMMLDSIMSAPMRFFDLNPLGRIMNRFSTDVGIIDDQLPIIMFDFLQITMIVLGSFGLAIFINYWIILPTIPLLFAFIYIRNYFITTSRELKRIEGICRSPIFVHANSSLAGLATIRASENKEKFYREFETHYDSHTKAYFSFICTQRWFSIRLDFIVLIYIIFSIFSSIVAKESLKLKSGEIGLLLVYLFQLSNLFYWTIKTSCEVENFMTSVERVLDYTTIKSEPLDKGNRKAPKDWPRDGKIEFENVSFSYDASLPNVLKDFSVVINPSEKIGVVGRTGAGKSSLFQTLFRMAEPTGKVLIDSLDIKEISLHELRSKIAIIPQEPTLFLGTVRSNLDPFNKKDDHALWNALEKVQLKEVILDMPGGLDAVIEKSGVNLSVGQKQLICLARAILKKSRILIIDEATANVDFNTDNLVQNAIRECFSGCTVLTIAHRLQTIMDCDRIMCLNDGKLENFDTPLNLLNDKNSLFFKLASMLGKKETDKLLQIAIKKKN